MWIKVLRCIDSFRIHPQRLNPAGVSTFTIDVLLPNPGFQLW